MSLSSTDCIRAWGSPKPENEAKYMALWDIPQSINDAIPALPNRLYCNRLMVAPLEQAFRLLIARGLHHEIKTYDGCFNVRRKRGLTSWSLHSWGVAIDLNAAWNGLGKTPQFSGDFARAWEESGFDWGGRWQMPRTDGMHFQLKKIT